MLPRNVEDFAYKAVLMGELEIDSEGRIWRVAARRWNRWIGATQSIPCIRRRAEKSTGKYLQIRVMVSKKRAHALSHRLVWVHFHNRPIPPGMTINHKDGNPTNNHPDNLELATHVEQTAHQISILGHDPRKNLKQYRGS